jgi:hypothetical protein
MESRSSITNTFHNVVEKWNPYQSKNPRIVRRTFRGLSVLPKKKNNAILLGTRFTTLWRSEIHINLKIDADALNRRRRRFCVRRSIYHIYHGQ